MEHDNSKIFYERFKGRTTGYCEICNEYKSLTFDHIPPKACGNTNINIGSFFDKSKKLDSPRGLMLRTICKECNNLLGQYDEKLVAMYKEFSGYINSTVSTYINYKIEGDVENIRKSIVGHLLAGFLPASRTVEPHFADRGNYRYFMREYLLNDKPLPKNIKIYYWFHLYNNFTFNPCFVYVLNFRKQKATVACAVLKFRPFAFMLVDYDDSPYLIDLPELASDSKDSFFLKYNSRNFLHFNYPFNVRKNEAILLSDENFYYGMKDSGKQTTKR